MCKISVIIPVFNVENYLEKCLNSILKQTFEDFEIVIVNDGSTDNSQKIIEYFILKYPEKIRSFIEENKGVSAARNYGIKKAIGEFVVFVDPDDVVSEFFLEELYKNAISNSCDVSICGYRFVKSQDENLMLADEKSIVYEKREFLNHYLVKDIKFVVVSMLIKRRLIIDEKIYFDNRIRFSEDMMFIWDIIISCEKVVYTNKELYGYYLRNNSTMTSSSAGKILDSYYIVKDKLKNLPIDKYPELKYALPRWELGALYTSSKLLDYIEFTNVSFTMNSKGIYRRLVGFKDIKAKILSFVLFVSNRIFYYICRKV